jgi:hypothetical protein
MNKRNQKRIIYLLALGLFLVAVVGVLNVFVFNEEKKIKKAIEEAKYCETKEDCVKISSQCPFGCWAVVNRNEAERIRDMINSYESNCVYGCVELKGFDCVEGSCQPLY